MNRLITAKVATFAILLSLLLLTISCNKKKEQSENEPRFTQLQASQTNIAFVNELEFTEDYNTYTYRNFYNGAGVGLGDFNNDGLPDIYFCGNLVDNKLYINKGNFTFEDVTEKAGVACPNVWSTGVSIVDVNGDGWLDIYVCKSGDPGRGYRRNELFINNGDLTFTEKATEYGIDDLGLSTHASFFDYDKDGDLDCYLLNNSFQSETTFDIEAGLREIRDTLGGNKLYRNDGNHFVDVSEEAGIYGSKIGFGLGASVGDLNRDGWMDIYISNDFFERDYLYINNQDGTFEEALEKQFRETSFGAMGADVADINNDAFPDIFVTEMTAEGNARRKTKVLFENWEQYQMKIDRGYFHQFARNVLQLNNKNSSFSEIGRFANVSSTDWSWGALIMDFDNDGWKDLFVANGIYKDLLDRDYLEFFSNPELMRSMIQTEEEAIVEIINQIPSEKIPNYAFHNNHDFTFTNKAEEWGLGAPSFSNGAAYGDLDNDGDLDLVVNNVNMLSFVFKNETREKSGTNYITIKLNGSQKNTSSIGAEITLHYNGNINYQEIVPIRGFKSTVDNRAHFGLGDAEKIDSLIIQWPDGKITTSYNLKVNQFLELNEEEIKTDALTEKHENNSTIFHEVDSLAGVDYSHQENDFSDFQRERLLFTMLSNEGPHMAVADANGDGKDDFFVCGAKDSAGKLFIQKSNGDFTEANNEVFDADKISEDTDCTFFDADGDGDFDLYVTSGGNEFPQSSSALRDRLYINNGTGGFTKSKLMLPTARYESSSCVKPADFDNDGDVDLFVGTRLFPFSYGVPVNGYLLENDGTGTFSNVTNEKASELLEVGMITDMSWADVDADGDSDIIIVGDWMPVKMLINENGIFNDESESFGLENTEGRWNVIEQADLNGDGNIDFVLGNHGMNSFFKASQDQPVTMYVNDFDMNGSVEQIVCTYENGKLYPMAMKDDLVEQIPSLAKKYVKFEDYKNHAIEDIFSEEVLQRSVKLEARNMESSVLINSGNNSFEMISLPPRAQFFPVYSVLANDFDNDGNCDILIGGNQRRAKPETGIYDAGYGLVLKGTADNKWEALSPTVSGIFTQGEIRDIEFISVNGKRIVVIARNNDKLQFYKF